MLLTRVSQCTKLCLSCGSTAEQSGQTHREWQTCADGKNPSHGGCDAGVAEPAGAARNEHHDQEKVSPEESEAGL